jgi:pimeloyl-ACP methyl ester carboxylesterase
MFQAIDFRFTGISEPTNAALDGCGGRRAGLNMARKNPRGGRAMPTLTVAGVGDLNYEVDGHGAPAFALMHGWCSNLRHWDRQVAAFKDRHKIVRHDRRGMGQSRTSPARSPSDHADDLARVMDAAGIDKAIVVGHAGGGAGAIDFAARYADRTLALIGVDTSAGAGDEAARAGMQRFVDNIKDDRAAFDRWYRSFFSPKAGPALVDSVVASAMKTPIEVACAELMGLGATNSDARAREVKAPVLWVTAQPVNMEALRGQFADVTPAVPVGSGHYLQLEVADQLNAMIQTFIDQRLT